ncbi:MAG: hypothetical protein R6V17_03480 [Halanaerobacter sp.]
MMLKILKGVFNNKERSADLGEELVSLLLELNSEEEIMSLLRNDSAQELEEKLNLVLVYSYLFSYKLVTRINDIRMDAKLLEEIYNNFAIVISKQRLEDYEIQVAELEEMVEDLVFNYQRNFAAKRNVEIEKVVELLCRELDEEIDLELKSALANFLLKNITIIQDFLVEKSLYLKTKY